MNITDLIQILEEIAENSPNAEVRFASQPSYPFEYSIREVVPWDKETMVENEIEEIRQAIEDDNAEPMSYAEMRKLAEQNLDDAGELEDVVYLEEGSQLGYLPEGPKNALGW
jgi:hypothetical protein